MGIYLVPPSQRGLIAGHAGFQDRGLRGMGIPGYTDMRGYAGFDFPMPIGARYFPPEPDYDNDTDNPLPIAAGYQMNGGREAYRQRVYNAAKADYKTMGFKKSEVDKELGPDAYGPDWTSKVKGRKVA